MNRRLKLIRIIVSIYCIEMITGALVGILPSHIGDLLIEMQLMHLVLCGALGWIALWLVFTMFFGRVYCSSVCPTGTLIDVLSRIVRRGRRYRFSLPDNALRYGMLALVVICMAIGLKNVPEVLDPDSAYAVMASEFMFHIKKAFGIPSVYVASASALGLFVAMAMLMILTIFARIGGRTFCNTLCPAGAILSLVSRNSVFHFDINTDLCTHCGHCEEVCKARCVDHRNGAVDMSRCVVCFNCTNVCGNGAVSYTARRHRLATPMLQRAKGMASAMQVRESAIIKHDINKKK